MGFTQIFHLINNYFEIHIAKCASDIDLVRVGTGGNVIYKKNNREDWLNLVTYISTCSKNGISNFQKYFSKNSKYSIISSIEIFGKLKNTIRYKRMFEIEMNIPEIKILMHALASALKHLDL